MFCFRLFLDFFRLFLDFVRLSSDFFLDFFRLFPDNSTAREAKVGGGKGNETSEAKLTNENVGDLLEIGGLQIEERAFLLLQLLPGR